VNPAPFEVQREELEGDILVFKVRGELGMNTATELEGQLKPVLEAADASVLLDLAKCEFIDSTGIALIVRAWQQLDRDGGGDGDGRLVICCINHQVHRLLKITGVDMSIPLHEHRDAAIAALGR